MNILVTRTLPAGEQLVNMLRARGKSAWYLPLIEVTAGNDLPKLAQRLADLSAGDLLFIISQHVINYAHPWLMQQGVTWPASLHYFAVGRTTGRRLHGLCGQLVSYPDEGGASEDLLHRLALARIDGKSALILRGDGGREVLAKTLRHRGVHTTYCECYRRTPIHYDGEEQGWRMRMLGIDTLVITSGEMLQQFYTLMPKHHCNDWLRHCRLIVISERLAMLACKLGWTDIVVAKAPDNDAVMRVLL